MYTLDSIDKKILNILQDNARNSASNIAELIGMSIPAVTDRIRKLQDSGFIKGFKAVIDSKKLGYDVAAIITIISESSENYSQLIKNISEHQEILKCYSTTGNGSHVLIVNTQNSASLEKLLRTIQGWPGVMRTETQIILTSYKDDEKVKIPL